MLPAQRTDIAHALARALAALGATIDPATLRLDPPKQAEHGDIATNVAMQYAKALGKPPRAIAEAVAASLLADASMQSVIAAADIAGPGFLNLRLTDAARALVVSEVNRQGQGFGCLPTDAGKSVIVEFVSANPTGPLHVGHGRQAALGDALSALLAARGWKVHREFYYNDAGAQINNLALSVQARARGIAPDDERFPSDGYKGEYIVEIARAYMAKQSVGARDVESVVGTGDTEDLETIRHFAVAYLRNEQDLDLQAFGVQFDRYYLESSLYTEGLVEDVVAKLVASGYAYEHEGALWLRTTDFDDDKDRVMRKKEGGYTYFVPDVAYHRNKFQRGFSKAINIQGSDHHGTIARVRAGLQALEIGVPKGFPDYMLHKMVTVMRGGEEVKISKRAGSYVTLRDLIDWTGCDAVRFFLISRRADSEFVFDVDLAIAQSNDNPVYYVQYAHARICRMMREWVAQGGVEADLARVDLSPLSTAPARQVLKRLASYPDVLAGAADDLTPHAIPYYLRELAGDYHAYYNAERVLVDDAAVRDARVALCAAVRQVLRNGLGLMGVSAPEQM